MKDFWKYFGPAAGVVIVLWFGWWLFVNSLSPQSEYRASVGDLFGGVNALFSGLALAGIVTTIFLQSRELQLQREELKSTRDVLEKTAAANAAAAKALDNQIEIQVLAAELNAVSTLLNSVNSQLNPGADGRTDFAGLRQARGVYHARLHEVLAKMGRSI